MKNDLKYIIKKIIIGIGIALGIMFFKPYIAFAEELNFYARYPSTTYQFTNPNDRTYYDIGNFNLNSYNIHFNYNYNKTKYIYWENKNLNTGILYFYNEMTNNFVSVDFVLNNNNPIKNQTESGSVTSAGFGGGQSFIVTFSLDENYSTEIFNNISDYYTQKTYNDIYFNAPNSNTLPSTPIKYFFDNYFTTNEWVITSTNYESVKINGEEQINDFPPNGYEEINLNGYQAVLVTPKNYNTMIQQSSHTEEIIPGTIHTYLDLDYYSKNCVRGVLINIQNVQNILTSDISSGSGLGASAGAINGTCFEEPTLTTLSYQYDIYSGFTPQGILIYNNQKIEPNWDSGFNSDFNPFGESFVWVNTNLYNYYLISNLSTFNADINYFDYDNTEKKLKIENLPTFEDLIEDTQLNQDSVNDNLNTRAKLESIFSFVKIPFTFLNNLINGTCEPLTARFPHSSTDIVLPCLSSSFAGWLGENAYKFFQLIINGLLVYKISIGLIQFTTKNLDPSDARIEVLDL